MLKIFNFCCNEKFVSGEFDLWLRNVCGMDGMSKAGCIFDFLTVEIHIFSICSYDAHLV